MARSLEERAASLLGRDDAWCQVQGRDGMMDEGTWTRFTVRIPPEALQLIDGRVGASMTVGPRTRQDLFLAAMRLYFEAVQPESADDQPIDGIDVVDINRRRLAR